MMKGKQEQHQLHTLYNHGDGRTMIGKGTLGSVYLEKQVMAMKSAEMVRASDLINNLGKACFDDSGPKQETPRRLKNTSLTKTNHQVQDDVNNPTEDHPSSFFDSSTSPETINARLVSELDKIKESLVSSLKKIDESFVPDVEAINARLVSELDKIKGSLVSSLKRIDESFARDVATRIEYNHNDEFEEDSFLVKKELEVSDVGSLCRLILKKDSVESYIWPFWGPDLKVVVQSGTGIRVAIYDKDAFVPQTYLEEME